MNWLISKLPLVGKVHDAVNGSKTYLGGGVLLLTGGAKVLLGAAAIASAVLAVGDAAGLVELVRNAASLPGLSDIQAGAAQFALGLMAVGLRHAVAKQEPKAP